MNSISDRQKSVTVLVTGSIAAYKSAEIIRLLNKAGLRVRVAMSKAATEFISPLTLQTLSGEAVTTELFDLQSESEIGHITLADSADLILMAPATANSLAKAANGLADDVPCTVLLAAKCPILFAPALNVHMWQHPATQANVATLRSRGAIFIEPESGDLACGWQGAGRLAEPADIVAKVTETLALDQGRLAEPKYNANPLTVIITSGATREFIDPIRYCSNRSSGKMGLALAEQALCRGALVELVSGPNAAGISSREAAGLKHHPVESALEMQSAIIEIANTLSKQDSGRQLLFIFAAAVADHRPAQIAGEKMKKDKKSGYLLEFVPNPDILAEFVAQTKPLLERAGHRVLVIAFAAETEMDQSALLEAAASKMKRKGADFIVANHASAMGSDDSRAAVLDSLSSPGELSSCRLQQMSKAALASELLKMAQCRFASMARRGNAAGNE